MVAAAPAIQAKLDSLRVWLRSKGSVLVCYSGGIDSAFLLAVATQELKSQAVGLTALSPSLATTERQDAEAFARQIGAVHHLAETHEIDRPGYAQNDADRCFHCKTELYEVAERKRREWGLSVILNGTNTDDLGDYRPGLVAATRAKVKSPLVELGFNKADVRAAARHLGLDLWDKPAAACLSSRIPYGTSVTPERLSQVEQLETALKTLGFRQLRVRWHDKIARIELGVDELPRALEPELRESIVQAGKRCGFCYITLDLAGYRQGSHNEVLPERRALRVL
jgi:uncharacterized protein